MTDEFSGRSYGVGSVRGVRSFDVDEFGRLRGVSYKDAWKPGENVAVCGRTRPAAGWTSIGGYSPYTTMTLYVDANGRQTNSPPMVPTRPEPHSLADCSHGFYAYYDGSNDYKADSRISAVVEGYGETLIGTRGFRSEKAKIVALCVPDSGKGSWRSRLSSSLLLAWLWGASAVLNGYLAVHRFFDGEVGMAILSIALAGLAVALVVLNARAFSARTVAAGKGVPAATVEKIRRNYPDAEVFTSFAAMVAAFPPDKGLEPSPETDPDFWSRP